MGSSCLLCRGKQIPIRPGNPRKMITGGLQGHKRVIGGPFQRFVIPQKAIPHLVMLQVIRIHDTVLIPLPWEVTQEMGRRIADKARDSGEKAGLKVVTRYVVTDTSNGYCIPRPVLIFINPWWRLRSVMTVKPGIPWFPN